MDNEYTTVQRTAVVAQDSNDQVMGVEISNGAPGGITEAEARLGARLAGYHFPFSTTVWLVHVPIR